jgi:hypothetical protein
MSAFGDARDASTDSIRVVEGLLAHFIKVLPLVIAYVFSSA